ncbi:MAG: hypothetical protein KC454_12010 [Flavobacteriales bacterium]|jgi:hypothetical protein|nr:hypothetical protein [Flavobacteriales bacterium]
MTPKEYNELDEKRKIDIAWFLWESYVNLDAPTYNEPFHFMIYGSKRLLVNAKNIHRRDQKLFEDNILQRLDPDSVPNTKEKLFPIEALKRPFECAETVVIQKDIPLQRFPWIDFKISENQILKISLENPYNVCSFWGIPCIHPFENFVIELPAQYLQQKKS